MKNLTVFILSVALSLPVAAFAVSSSPESALPAWALDASRAGVITMEFDLSDQPMTSPTRLWVPYPVSDPDQLVTDIHFSGDYAESSVTTDQVYGNAILYARWDKGAKSRKMVLSFHVVRQQVVRRSFPAKEGAWNREDFRQYLEPTGLAPDNADVKVLVEQITAGKTGVLDKARAIYDWVVDNMHRDPDTVGCGLGKVDTLLRTLGGKCTDIHSVFVALARAAGLPAREIFGIRQGKTATADITTWQHCWAEFFLPGYGWVPVDPADVLKIKLVDKLNPDDPLLLAFRKYYWGAWDAYRAKLAVGRDLILNPRQEGPPLNTFGYPYAEVGGKPLNFYDPSSFSYRFSYKEQ